jgi:hypothetical protein
MQAYMPSKPIGYPRRIEGCQPSWEDLLLEGHLS